MSTDPAMKAIPHAALISQRAAKISATNHAAPLSERKQEDAATDEQLSPDILAFCKLLARIVLRCLTQKDARVLSMLSLPSHQGKQRQE